MPTMGILPVYELGSGPHCIAGKNFFCHEKIVTNFTTCSYLVKINFSTVFMDYINLCVLAAVYIIYICTYMYSVS